MTTPRGPRSQPDASIFRQTKPCSDCPFRREGGVVHSRQMMASYASYFLEYPGASFPCHQSVPKDDDRSDWSPWREGQTLCTGGMMFAEKQGRHNAIVTYGIAQGWYNSEKFEQSEKICDSLDELLDIATKGQ